MKKKLLLGIGVLLSWQAAVADTGFKPSGSLQFTQTFYGDAGGYKTSTAHPSLTFSYQYAPDWQFSFTWDRTWGLYDYTNQPNQQFEYFSQPVASLTNTYGNLGNSKVNWSTTLAFENQTDMLGTSSNYIYAQTAFDFSKYIPKSDFIQATQFAIAPQYVYGWNSTGGSGQVNTAGVALLTQWQLPANFSLTVNLFALRDWYTGAFELSGVGNNTYSSANYFLAFAWLQYQKTVYKFDQNTSLGFNFIGGLDPYMSSNRNASWMPFIAGYQQYEWLDPTVQSGNYNNTYILFALPQLMLTYQVNSKLSVNLFVQVKYSNQVWGDKVGGWSFQPQAGFGFTYNF